MASYLISEVVFLRESMPATFPSTYAVEVHVDRTGMVHGSIPVLETASPSWMLLW